MAEAVLGLGSNLGARRATFDAARALLEAQPGCRVLACSHVYETPPLGPPQPDFLNAALRVQWQGDPRSLLAVTQRIESWLGRERRERWGARTLDIDILHWSQGPVREPGLEVPHRELAMRAFALAPLLDVAPELSHRYASALAQQGGPPARACPEWLTLRDEGGARCSAWLCDPAELAGQLAALLATAWGPRPSARAVRPFVQEGALGDLARDSWLERVLVHARGDGFAVHTLVVREHDAEHVRGFLVGEACDPAGPLPPFEVQLEARAGDERRVRFRAIDVAAGERA